MTRVPTLMQIRLSCFILAIALSGCATGRNTNGSALHRRHADEMQDTGNIQIHMGKPNPIVQRLSSIADTPSRIVRFGPKSTRHEISLETQQQILGYLAANNLNDVYICNNEYDPAGEWERLTTNHAISPVWRYSFGVLNFIGYALIPEPVVCVNRYNPYTNRLSINRDVPVEILYEAACAKIARSKQSPGTYFVLTSLPGGSLIGGTQAVMEVISYAKEHDDWETEKSAYRKLFPRIGMEGSGIAMIALPVWWEGALIGLGGSAVGHVVGRYVEHQREQELAAEETWKTQTNESMESKSGPLMGDSGFSEIRQVMGP